MNAHRFPTRRRSAGARLAFGAAVGVIIGVIIGAVIAVASMTQGLQCHAPDSPTMKSRALEAHGPGPLPVKQ